MAVWRSLCREGETPRPCSSGPRHWIPPSPSLTCVHAPSVCQADENPQCSGHSQACLVPGSPSPSFRLRVVGPVQHPSTSWGIFCSLQCVRKPHSPCTSPVSGKAPVFRSQHKHTLWCPRQVKKRDFQVFMEPCWRSGIRPVNHEFLRWLRS